MNGEGRGVAVRHQPSLEALGFKDTTDILNQLHASVRLTVLRDPLRFNARVASLSIADTRYTLVSYGTDVRVDCVYDSPSESTILCLRGSCAIDADGESRRLTAGMGLLARPKSGLRAEFSRDCERLVIRSRRRELAAKRRPVMEDLRIELPYLHAIADLLLATSQSPALLTCLAQDEVIALPFRQLLERLLARAAADDVSRVAGPGPVPRAVVRVENLIRERAEDALTLAELAAVAQVSERALQAQFQQYRHCSPMTFLRDARLDMAQNFLSRPSTRETVSSVALRCGFNHFARFAAYYKARFGESPSRTKACANA